MLQANPEIEHIVQEATSIAKEYNHEYVTLEHIFLAMVKYKLFKDLLIKFGTDAEGLEKDIEAYLLGQDYLVVQDADPKRTNALERVFNRALT